MRKIQWMLSFFVLTGCLRPNYQPQYVDIPCEWRMATNEGNTLCNYRWWKQFQDPVLDELILIALSNNLDLQVAIRRVFEYYARLGISNAAFYPVIDGIASYNRMQSSIALPVDQPIGVPRTFNDFQGYLNGTWELDFWGRIYSANEASFAELLAQIQARRTVVMTVVTSVANAYFVLRQLDAQLQISKKTLESRLDSLRLAKDRFELGETSEIEVKQAEAEVEIAIIRVIEFERDIPRQENLLSILLGENPHSVIRGLAIDDMDYPLYIPEGLPSDLLTRRPDIMQAEDNLIAANARVTEARALYFPQITLTGQYGSESDQLKNFLSSPAEFWQYGVTAVQSIFDAGKIYYEVRVNEELRNQVLFTYRQTILNAFREVDDALITTEKNRELVTEHIKQVKILNEYLHLAQLRYEEGEIDYLNVLDAERQLFDTELQLAQAYADNLTAIVSLYKALGGGWVADADAIALECEY